MFLSAHKTATVHRLLGTALFGLTALLAVSSLVAQTTGPQPGSESHDAPDWVSGEAVVRPVVHRAIRCRNRVADQHEHPSRLRCG